MLEMRHLAHAVALAEHRNFARAAVSLNLSQPALSRSIQVLEAQLDLKLFDRNRKGVEPTEGGLLLLKRARDLLAQAEDLERETSAVSRGRIGEINIAVGPYPAKMIVGVAVGELLARHSNLKFRVIVDNWAEATRLVRERQVELAICDYSEADESVFDVTPLTEYQAYAVVRESHPLGRQGVKYSEVKRWPYVMSAAVPPRVLSKLTRGRNPEASSVALHCEDLEILKETVARSDLVMFSPLCVVERELRQGTLRVLPFEEPWLKTRFGLVKLKGRSLSPVTGHFVDEVLKADARCTQTEAALCRELLVNIPAA